MCLSASWPGLFLHAPLFPTPGVQKIQNIKVKEHFKCHETERPGAVRPWLSQNTLCILIVWPIVFFYGYLERESMLLRSTTYPMLLARLFVVSVKQHVVSSSRKERQNDSPFSRAWCATTIGPFYMVLSRHVECIWPNKSAGMFFQVGLWGGKQIHWFVVVFRNPYYAFSC